MCLNGSGVVLAAAACGLVVTVAQAQRLDLLYVLQPDTVSVQDLTDAAVDWLILEPTVDGTQATAFTAAEIEQIKTQGPCPKKILAYLSVGEAESYRDYFDPNWLDVNGDPDPNTAPPWLGPTNPDWEGNYKVRYWMPDWQHLIVGTDTGPHTSPYDAIIDQGFDGVYLDIIDAFEFWSSPAGGNERTRSQARTEMINFVKEIARHAQVVRGRPMFMVFPQGGVAIIRDDNENLDQESNDYFAAIDGVGREDVWYDELHHQNAGETAYTLDQLREYQSRGKTVLVTDYVIRAGNQSAGANNTRAADFISHAVGEGFVPYAALNNRELNAIVTFGGSGWTYAQPDPGCPGGGCEADLTGDGVLDFFDVSAFLAAFSNQEALADWNADGVWDFFDVAAYLYAFATGCG